MSDDKGRIRVSVDDEVALVTPFDGATCEFSRMRNYPELHGFMLVFDLTNQDSLAHLKEQIEVIHLYLDDDGPFPFVIVGNKADLGEQRRVSVAEGTSFAEELGTVCIEVKYFFLFLFSFQQEIAGLAKNSTYEQKGKS